jgi:hypothetical protein
MAAAPDTTAPTVVLVHGAFADGSSWNGVIERLQSKGVQVTAPAFAPDEGEALGDVEAGSKDGVLNSAIVSLHYPVNGGDPAVEFAIDPAKFRDAFAADLPPEQTALMAAAADRRARVLRAVRAARLEALALLGCRRHR